MKKLRLLYILAVVFVFSCNTQKTDNTTRTGTYAADSVITPGTVILNSRFDSVIHARQLEALDILSKEDTTAASSFWPGVNPQLFFSNIREHVLFPDKINQGRSTNFCGYAAITHLLVKYHPDLYTKDILQLYHSGKVSLKKKTLNPSEAVRKAAGTLKNKGELDVLHADQLWFLTLADQFKGYINIFNLKYDPGDETRIWAGANYGKFVRMLREFTNDEIDSRGSDVIRPMVGDFYDYIRGQLQKGVVVLYVNSKYLFPSKYTLITVRAPTHFIVAYNLYRVGDMIEFQYWDYGMRTQQQVTPRQLKQMLFGVTTISRITDEAN